MHDHNEAQCCLVSWQLVWLTCGPSLKPQTTVDSFSFAIFNSLSILTSHSEKSVSLPFYGLHLWQWWHVCCFVSILLYSYIIVQLHFAFLCIAMFLEYIDSETSNPDLKETFIVFMINQRVNQEVDQLQHYIGSVLIALTKWLPINIFLIISSVTLTAHYLFNHRWRSNVLITVASLSGWQWKFLLLT